MHRFLVIGAGYVGVSLAVLLAKENHVDLLDIDSRKVEQINNKQSPISDPDIDQFLNDPALNLRATTLKKEAYKKKDFFIISVPTNFDETKSNFSTHIVEEVIRDTMENSSSGLIVIKSTVPIGFTDRMNKLFNTERIIFFPEFLREGKAIYDNLNPTRIIIGGQHEDLTILIQAFLSLSNNKNVEVLSMSPSEAEAVKLFSNAYLAMRVAFFNEVDTFSLGNKLNTKSIIDGVSLDPRIGNYYNNPSFGYGGYCLPKDSKQLLSDFRSLPQELIRAIIQSNETRKNFLVETILQTQPKIVGVYRLLMKKNSDNFRESAVLSLLEKLADHQIKVLIYEPFIRAPKINNFELCQNLEEFKLRVELILANRINEDLDDFEGEIFTRDIYYED